MRFFQNTSIRRKQTQIMMLTSSVALLLACAAFVINDTVTFRRELAESVSVLAEAVGNNCAAAIDFNDPKAARETLAALRANDNIVSACVYARDGQVFAVYQRDPAASFAPPAVRAAGQEFANDELHLFRSVKQQDEVVGTIFIASNLDDLWARFIRYLGIVAFVFLVSSLLALLLSSRLQRLVSDPILHLAQVARQVATQKNYTLRAARQGNDELGQLADGFNEMLWEIQQRDVALQTGREELEARVAARTAELAESNAALQSENAERRRADELLRRTEALYRSAIAGAGAVPYSLDFKTRSYVFMGEGIQQLIGYAPHEVNGEFWKSITQQSVMLGEAASVDKSEAARRVKSGELLHWRCDMLITTRAGESRWISDASVQNVDASGQVIGAMGILQDITERKQAEAELKQTHKQLLETSRLAGMAEIATNVLHNIGNVLNSVNVSASVVANGVKKSKAASLVKVVALLREHEPDLGTFFTSDPRGRQLPAYLAQLTEHFLDEQKASLKELDLLQGNIDHIKEIVAMQQNYAKVSGLKEIINLNDLVEDCLRMNDGAMSRHQVEVVREFGLLPPVNVEKHKILQILVNLVRNSKHACQDSARVDRRITVRTRHEAGQVRISVTDNGVGIAPENMTRIFNHGFTTRKDGHGFGLHSGALAAQEMGGTLDARSGGIGMGATFTLALPLSS